MPLWLKHESATILGIKVGTRHSPLSWINIVIRHHASCSLLLVFTTMQHWMVGRGREDNWISKKSIIMYMYPNYFVQNCSLDKALVVKLCAVPLGKALMQERGKGFGFKMQSKGCHAMGWQSAKIDITRTITGVGLLSWHNVPIFLYWHN